VSLNRLRLKGAAMRRSDRQSAFSLLELLVVMATILLLAGALLGVGKYITTRASADLTESELEVIATALQQYYDDMGDFPPETVTQADFETALMGQTITFTSGSGIPDGVDGWRSAALFYFLDRNPNSRKIIEALTDSLISSKNAAGVPIKITIGANPAIDFPRFVDAWGTSIRYEYATGMVFPVLTSAGPDKTFGTADDIQS
jgi:type II secretory pathway pseudopilin PulG